eukprot:scaffold38025_cov25-Tisochrysis_lutea.AAC.4
MRAACCTTCTALSILAELLAARWRRNICGTESPRNSRSAMLVPAIRTSLPRTSAFKCDVVSSRSRALLSSSSALRLASSSRARSRKARARRTRNDF